MPDSSQNFYNKILGSAGEKRAADYLKKRGYKIISRNYRTPFGEADIVAEEKKSGDTVFVEVKTRTNDGFSTPAAAVTKEKQKRYRQIAKYYMANVGEEIAVRFDVVEVLGEEINHIIGAFY